MKIVGIMDDDTQVEIKEIKGIDVTCDCLIIKSDVMFSDSDIEKMEKSLTDKTGVKCVIPKSEKNVGD
jgi:hypothetical protein